MKARLAMSDRGYASVWNAISDTEVEATNLRLRTELMVTLKHFIKHKRLGQVAAAKRLGVTLPRLAELMHGKINVFELDDLVAMAVTAGMHVELCVADSAGGNA